MVKTIPIAESADYIGKEAANKLAAAPRERDVQALAGLDLKVGGEGMRAFYDKIVPNVANGLLKKLGGGRVSPIRVAVADLRDTFIAARADDAFGVTNVETLRRVRSGLSLKRHTASPTR